MTDEILRTCAVTYRFIILLYLLYQILAYESSNWDILVIWAFTVILQTFRANQWWSIDYRTTQMAKPFFLGSKIIRPISEGIGPDALLSWVKPLSIINLIIYDQKCDFRTCSIADWFQSALTDQKALGSRGTVQVERFFAVGWSR